MTTRACEDCGRHYEAASARSRFCSSTCRSRAHRAGGGKAPPAAAGDNVRTLRSVDVLAVAAAKPSGESDEQPEGLAASLERRLRDVDRLDSWEGQGALTLARRIESGRDTGSAISSLHRELRAAVAEAMKGVAGPQSALQKHRDELARRRGHAGA